MTTITIKLNLDEEVGRCQFDVDENAERQLEKECQRTGRSREDVILDIVSRRIWLMEFDRVREEIAPYAEKAGYTEEEILSWPRPPVRDR